MTSKADRLLKLAKQAEEAQKSGAEKAGLAVAGSQLGGDAKHSLELFGHLDQETAGLLEELSSAQEETRTDPWVRRAWLSEQLEELAEMETPPARRSAATIMAATGKRMPRSEKPALPVLTAVGPKEFGNWPQRTVICRAIWRNGKLQGTGICALVPTHPSEDKEAYSAMRQVRAKARLSLLREMQGELMFPVRDAAWLAIWLVNGARVSSKEWGEEQYENGEEGILVDKKRGQRFRYHPISDDEIFITPDDRFGREFVATLSTLDTFQEKFWAGELDIDAEVGKIVAEAEPEAEITPKQFLDGDVPGFTIIQHDSWKVGKDGDKTIQVFCLFERRKDGQWRWTMANPEGVNALFGGKRLRFHNWTGVQIPGHVEALLTRGEQVLSATIDIPFEDEMEEEAVEQAAN